MAIAEWMIASETGCCLRPLGIVMHQEEIMIDIPGFQVENKIYDSVRSIVYRAKQIEGDRPVILKTLREEYPVPQEIHGVTRNPGLKQKKRGSSPRS